MNQKASRVTPLLRAYQAYLVDGESASFIRSIASLYSLATLERLASNGDVMMRRAAVLAIGQIGHLGSVGVVGPLLGDIDRRVRMVADDAYKSLWYRAAEPRARNELEKLLVHIEADRMPAAMVLADDFVQAYPDLPEGYCRRALVEFNLNRLDEAIRDCETCIQLSQYHYMAWIGIGQCRLEQDDPRAALEAFRQALAIYPDLDVVRVQIKRLERMLRERT